MRRNQAVFLFSSFLCITPACISLSTTENTGKTNSGVGGNGGEQTSSSSSGAAGVGGTAGSNVSSSSSSGGGNTSPLPGWSRRRPVIIQPVMATLDNFMLLISVKQDAQIGADAKTDGDDLVFTDSDGTTILPHEMEFYNAVNGAADFVAWVRVPQIPAAGKTIYLYWGKPNIGPQQDPAMTWQDFAAVYHLEADFNDSTKNAHHGNVQTPSGPAPSTETGMIANGKKFLGGSLAEIDSSSDFDCAMTPCTISAWINNSSTKPAHIVDRYIFNATSTGWYMGTENATLNFGFEGDMSLYMSNPVSNGMWLHVAAVVSQSGGEFYVNGNLEDTDSTFANPIDAMAPLYIGSGNLMTYFFQGKLDEVRIAHTARSDAWLKAEVDNAQQPDQFVTLGPVEMY